MTTIAKINHKNSMLALIGKTVVLSTSGALSPGPLSASALALGAIYGWTGGILLAIGHTIAELPYVILLFVAMERVSRKLKKYDNIMSFLIGVFMLFFAVGVLSLGIKGSEISASESIAMGSLFFAVMIGASLTLLNPYFLGWWLTVGEPIIKSSVEHGRKGLAVMYASHVWMDYAWLTFLAVIGTGAVLSMTVYRVVMIGVGIILAYYGIKYVAHSLNITLRGKDRT